MEEVVKRNKDFVAALDTGGKSQGSQKEIAVESIDWRLRGILIVVR